MPRGVSLKSLRASRVKEDLADCFRQWARHGSTGVCSVLPIARVSGPLRARLADCSFENRASVGLRPKCARVNLKR